MAVVPPYVHGPVPLTPSPLTPCPNPKSPNPLSQPPGNPKGVLAPTHHDVPPYLHGPVPLTPDPLTPCPNPKSPNPLSQPPGNPKGVLVPKHHDVPPTHHFFLFFKGCTATSDVILASHLWLLQVTGFVVSQVTRVPTQGLLRWSDEEYFNIKKPSASGKFSGGILPKITKFSSGWLKVVVYCNIIAFQSNDREKLYL